MKKIFKIIQSYPSAFKNSLDRVIVFKCNDNSTHRQIVEQNQTNDARNTQTEQSPIIFSGCRMPGILTGIIFRTFNSFTFHYVLLPFLLF